MVEAFGYRAKLKFGIIASCAAFGICSLAFAADEPDIAKHSPASGAAVKDDTPALEAVIITAERRSQSLQKVPISITALTGEDIEQSKIGSIIDVQQLVPGLLRKNRTSSQF